MNKKIIGITVTSFCALTFAGCSKVETQGEITKTEVTTELTTQSDGTQVVEENYSIKDDGYFKDIITGKKNPKVERIVEYKTDWTDNSWDNIKLSIDRVKAVEVDKYTDGSQEVSKALLSLRFILENNSESEVNINPADSVLVLKGGEEIEATHIDESWKDIFSSYDKTTGYIHFKLKDAVGIDAVETIKVMIKGHFAGDTKEKTEHDYQINLPLELAN